MASVLELAEQLEGWGSFHMDVTEVQVESIGDEVELSALIRNQPFGVPDLRIWFRFPRRSDTPVVPCGDPFLAALLPCAARTGQVLRVHAPVSKQLQANCRMIGEIWEDWFGTTTQFEVDTESLPGRDCGSSGVGCFFTGGVDSFYSVLKNLERQKGENRLTDLIYVGGFDIPLQNVTLYQRVANELDQIGESLGIPVCHVTSNLRDLTDLYAGWGVYQHGAALSAVGHCMQGYFRSVMIPASHTYALVFPWGTHPLLDPLWSSESLTVIPDGCEADRMQKILRQVARSDVALDHLRVCFLNPESAYNCGACEKCIRTMIELTVAGVGGRCRTMPKELDLDLVRKIKIKHRITERFALESLAELKKVGTAPDLEQALQEAITKGGVHVFRNQARRKLSSLDYKYLGGRVQMVSMKRRARKRMATFPENYRSVQAKQAMP